MTQPTMTRIEFNDGLSLLRKSLFTMTGTVTEAIQAATTALLDQNLEAARATAALKQQLEDDRMLIEQCTLQLLTHQRTVAGDLRLLVSAIKISAECRRMGVLAHHIGMAARRCHPAAAVPEEFSGIFRRMGDVVSWIADGARVTLLTSDALDAAGLEDDDTMDGLCRALFRALLDNSSHGTETAVNVASLGRQYERFADHAVALAQSVIFMLTPTKPRVEARRWAEAAASR
jgi:phosphate transport system protein